MFARTKHEFRVAKGCKPRASRDLSRETFVVATGYRGPKRSSDTNGAEPAGEPPSPKPGWDG